MRRPIRLSIFVLLILIALQATIGWSEPLVHPDRIIYPPLHFKPPQAERVVLDNGIVLFIIEDHEIPLVNISTVFRAGSNYDPVGKEGLAEMTATLMRTGGIATMAADRVDRELDQMAAQIYFSAGMESCSAGISVHKKDLEPVMRLFSGMLTKPAFASAKLEIARNVTIESLSRIYDDQQRLAFREFRKLIYAGNPRGNLPNIQSISGLTRDDLADFHRRYFFPANTWIAVSGDITRSDALALIKRHLASWKHPGRLPAIPDPAAGRKRIYVMEKEGPQSVILLGHIVSGKSSPDFYALSVLDFILGSGGFRSRLTQGIRNERGLAYSAGGYYSARPHYGILQAYTLTKTGSTAEVISLMQSIIRSIRERPITPQELDWAKRALTNRFIFSLESPDRIAVQQMMLDFDGLPPDFLSRYPAGIETVTIDDIRRTASKYLDPEKALIFLVGDEKKFNALSSFGEVTRIDWKK